MGVEGLGMSVLGGEKRIHGLPCHPSRDEAERIFRPVLLAVGRESGYIYIYMYTYIYIYMHTYM